MPAPERATADWSSTLTDCKRPEPRSRFLRINWSLAGIRWRSSSTVSASGSPRPAIARPVSPFAQGYDDLLDLLQIFSAQEGASERVYLIGASMGGQIATLLQEDHPELFDATMAVCAPIGDFTSQLDYFGHGRVLVRVLLPGMIPGPIFDPTPELIANWPAFYNQQVRPKVLALHNRSRLNQLVRTANLPVSPTNYLQTAEGSVRALLDFVVLEIDDTIETLGGFPFENQLHWYAGSWNDLQLNLQVTRFHAEAVALQEIQQYYDTRGVLSRPLITMHTLLDEVVPYEHEIRYTIKTLAAPPSWINRANIPVVRYGHCNFKLVDAALAVGLLLTRAGELQLIFGLDAALNPAELASFEQQAATLGIPYEVEGEALGVVLIEP